MTSLKSRFIRKVLKSLGPIDRKFYGHGEIDGFVLCEYVIKQCSTFREYTNINVMKEIKEKHNSHVNSNQNEYGVTPSFVSHCFGPVPSL